MKKIDKHQQVRKDVFLECLMYETMTEGVAMAADKRLFLIYFSIKMLLLCGCISKYFI